MVLSLPSLTTTSSDHSVAILSDSLRVATSKEARMFPLVKRAQ